jgi:hypothetical protein
MPRYRTPLLVCLLIGALAALPAAAKIPVAVGIGDQNGSVFIQKSFQALHVKKIRYYIRWDAIRKKGVMRGADQFVRAARANHVRVLMHITTNNYVHKKAKLPSVALFRRDVKPLVRHYRRLGVREWGVWNEENHVSEPTYRSPQRAAQYFHAFRSLCRGCTIVALDLLDQANSSSYVRRFYGALSAGDRAAARIVGIHNYEDVNRHRMTGTKRIIAAVRKENRRAQFWLTETGGLVNFGRSFPCNQQRAARSISYMFRLVRKYRRYVKRLYVFRFYGTKPSCGHFDAGLVNWDGSPRPAYRTFKRLAAGYIR